MRPYAGRYKVPTVPVVGLLSPGVFLFDSYRLEGAVQGGL